MLTGLEPDEDVGIREWANKYRWLPKAASSEYGKYRSSRTPYLHKIMDDLSPQSPVHDVVVVKATQLGMTDGLGNNLLMYTAHKRPRPCLMILPTVELARRHSRSKIDTSLAVMRCMDGLIRDSSGHKKRDESVLLKEFPGGYWMLLGSNSASAARSVSICILVLDDVDGFVLEMGDEGDPIDIIKKRTDSFAATAKRLLMSTPASLETSRIWIEFGFTDQQYYHVPCPHCDHGQRLLLGGKDTDYGLKWTNNDPDTAYYLCEQCHEPISEVHKTAMLEQGDWIASNPGVVLRPGYHISSLYSPYGWVSWAQIAKEFLDCYKEPRKLKVFKNTREGLPWEEKGQQPEWTLLQNRAEPYKFWTAPEGVGFITAGVDVQQNRLSVVIVGWGRDEESWVLWWGELFGDTAESTADVWTQLDSLMNRPFTHAYGFDLRPICIAVDSGDNTHTVYNFTRKRPKFIAIKGQSTKHKPVLGRPTKQDVNYQGNTIKNGVDLWPVGSDAAKILLYERLVYTTPGPEYVHFTLDLPKDYYRQLTAEKRLTRYDKLGFAHKEWHLPKHARNEGLDCTAYALAAAIKAGLLHVNWDQLYTSQSAKKTTSVVESKTQPTVRPLPQPTPPTIQRRRRYTSASMRR
jgi:phage terminase large subunit GpA-like protein